MGNKPDHIAYTWKRLNYKNFFIDWGHFSTQTITRCAGMNPFVKSPWRYTNAASVLISPHGDFSIVQVHVNGRIQNGPGDDKFQTG